MLVWTFSPQIRTQRKADFVAQPLVWLRDELQQRDGWDFEERDRAHRLRPDCPALLEYQVTLTMAMVVVGILMRMSANGLMRMSSS